METMIRRLRRTGVALIAVLTSCLAMTDASAQPAPDRWEKEAAAFEASDRVAPPQPGGIVFVGSSSIRHWNTAASFPDLKIINRGIWVDGLGFELADAV